MLLKAITTSFVLLGIGLMVALPFILGARPVEGDKHELARFGTKLVTVFAVACAAWVGAAICAIILARRTKREFIESQKENVRDLVEGTINDHARKF